MVEIEHSFPHPEWSREQREEELDRIVAPFVAQLIRRHSKAILSYHYDATGEYVTDWKGERREVPWKDPAELAGPGRRRRQEIIDSYKARAGQA